MIRITHHLRSSLDTKKAKQKKSPKLESNGNFQLSIYRKFRGLRNMLHHGDTMNKTHRSNESFSSTNNLQEGKKEMERKSTEFKTFR